MDVNATRLYGIMELSFLNFGSSGSIIFPVETGHSILERKMAKNNSRILGRAEKITEAMNELNANNLTVEDNDSVIFGDVAAVYIYGESESAPTYLRLLAYDTNNVKPRDRGQNQLVADAYVLVNKIQENLRTQIEGTSIEPKAM